ncbi:MAG: S41 family peptidase [Chloroflexi bacterium]|nr:S41 family peptidase [Chloroflexota bacterium]
MTTQTILRRLAVLLAILLLLVVGTGAGVALDREVLVAHAQSGTTPANGPDFQLITEAWNTIQREYVDHSAEQSQPLTYGAISGMVDALGDTGHSTFLSPQMVKSENDYTQGKFEGIGAEVEEKNGNVVIVAPIDGSPAQKAGLHAGEAILKVDGNDVSGLPLEQVVGKILGPAGTQVTLTLLDPNTGKTSDVTLTRASITINNVTWQRLPGTNVAHLRIAGFSQGVTQDLKQALTDMKQQGVTAVILDLRNNPGGLLDEAVNTTSQFLSSGDVLLEKNAQGQVTHVTVRSGGIATEMPMAVLVNNGSASASEIVAGALQDAHRGTLIGETTFGTGTVLNEFPLSDGSALMLAVEEWLTPSGRVIWHKGITPDQTVTLPSDAMALTPEAERGMTAEQLQASGDQQLLQALQLLNQSASGKSSGKLGSSPAPRGKFSGGAGVSVGATLSAPFAVEPALLEQFCWI